MAIVVNHPVLGEVSFPDNYTMEQIDAKLLELGASILEEKSSGEVFFNQLGEGFESSFEGLSQLTGLGFYEDSYEDEFRSRVELEQNPVAGYGGYIVGSILDPVTVPAAFLKPITIGGKVATGIARGGIVGAAGGGVEPVFEQFGDDRAFNTSMGALFGGALGGALNRVIASDVARKTTRSDLDDAVDESLDDLADSVDEPITVGGRVDEAETDAPDPIVQAYDDMLDELDPEVRAQLPEKPRVKVRETDEGTQLELIAPEAPAPVLPKSLSGAKPRFNQANIQFNNDLEKALYIIGRGDTKSARHDDYVDFVKQATGLDDASVKALAKDVQKDLVTDLKKQSISRGAQGEQPSVLTPAMSSRLEPIVQRPQEVLTSRTVPRPPPVQPKAKPRIRMKPNVQGATTPITNALESIQGSVGAMQTPKLRQGVDVDLGPEELGRLRSEGFGQPRMRREQRSGKFSTDPETGEKIYTPGQPRMVEDAVPEFNLPAGRARDVAAKIYQSVNKLRRGANAARGRVDTRGKGTQLARRNAAARLVKNLQESGKHMSDYFMELDKVTPTDIYAYGRAVEPEVKAYMNEAAQVFDDLVEAYGTLDAIPKKMFDDVIKNYMNAFLLNRKMTGALTESSDMLNARRFLLDDFKKDDKVRALLGVRCI